MTNAAPVNPLLEFVERYGPPAGEAGPEMFVREVLGADPDDWQIEVLRAYGRGERGISIASCHGPGKTTVLSWIIWHQLVTRFPQKTACTAPTSSQLNDALLAEVKMWHGHLPKIIRDLFEVKTDIIQLKMAPAESFATFKTARAEQPEAIQGVHSAWVLLIADEASGIHEKIFEAASGSMSGERACTILAGNPVRTTGLFFDTHHKLVNYWFTVQVSAIARPGAYVSKRVSAAFVESMRLQYGEDSNAFRVRVLGLFPRSDLDTIIAYELVEGASGRDVKPSDAQAMVWGLDVARYGDCLTALAKRRGNVSPQPVQTWHGLDTMQVVGVVKAEWDATILDQRPLVICVDAIGLGAGVADRLKELGLPARAVNVSEVPSLMSPLRFVNLRTELWWKAREWFTRRDCSIPAEKKDAVQADQRESLQSELVRIKYKIVDSSGKLRAESKDEMRKRGFKSPDRADAFVLTFAADAITALMGAGNASWKKPLLRNRTGVV